MKMEQDPRFKHLEAVVGAFVIGALAAIVAVVLYIGSETDLFGEKYYLRFKSHSGTGIQKGMPVKLSGFRIGRIHGIELDDQAKVIVRMKIDGKYSRWIRSDSVATLLQEGLVGDSVIDVSVGSPGKPVLANDEFLPFEEEERMTDIALEMSESVKAVLEEVRQTVAYINDPQGDIKRTLANVQQVTAGLDRTRRNADILILAAADDTRRAGAVIDNLAAIADNVGRRLPPLLDNVSARLPALLDRVEGTVSNAEKISLEFRKAAEQAAPRVPPLLLGTEELVEDTDDVVKGMKKMWPLRKHIPQGGKPGIVPGDSHE
jgi:phospholipid/cholesterol/gamma-HCH transport system substrate-binding protein